MSDLQKEKLTQKTDKELMGLYQDGIYDAFLVLYERWSPRVMGYLHKHTFDKNLLDDIFQNVFLKLHKSRFQYSAEFEFAAWIFTIVKTTLIDFLRTQKKMSTVSDSDFELQKSDLHESDLLHMDTERDTQEQLESSLKKLSPLQQEVLDLRYKKDLSFSEIAKKLNKTPVNIRQIVSRALKALRSNTHGSSYKGSIPHE